MVRSLKHANSSPVRRAACRRLPAISVPSPCLVPNCRVTPGSVAASRPVVSQSVSGAGLSGNAGSPVAALPASSVPSPCLVPNCRVTPGCAAGGTGQLESDGAQQGHDGGADPGRDRHRHQPGGGDAAEQPPADAAATRARPADRHHAAHLAVRGRHGQADL